MKRLLLSSILLTSCFSVFSQHYVENGGFENWENEGTDLVEPVEWNSFRTASGALNSFAPNDPIATKTTDAHSGQFAVKIETVSGPFGVIVNGNLTCGRINMGSTSPTNQSNHNWTVTSDTDFNQSIANTPDSIIAWVKYVPVGNDSAVISSQVHDDFDFEFPMNTESENHGIAYAQIHIGPTANWTRLSIPYEYTGLSMNNPAYVLINIASSAIPGGGEVGSTFYVDDVQLKYNELSTNSVNELPYSVHNTPEGVVVNLKSDDLGELEVVNITGQVVKTQRLNNKLSLVSDDFQSGIYLFNIKTDKGTVTRKVFIP